MMKENDEHYNNTYDDRQQQTSQDRNTNHDYVDNHKIWHLKTPTEAGYVVPWYEYALDSDTNKQAEHVTRRFHDAYRRRMRKQRSTGM